MDNLVEKIKELFVLYDEFGSEMNETETNFIDLLLSKAMDKGLTTEMLSPGEIGKINQLHTKYSQLESFDSEEGQGYRGM